MENSVEIWVEVNGEKRLLDVYEQEVISLNYSLADIQDISKRNTSFSKTISLPDSKSNREAFEFISELNADSLFNQNLKTSCWIYCNSLLIFRGNLQLKKVNTDYVKDITSLEVVVYGETETFISSMGERYLSDLDLSYLDHTWNYDNIAYSWTQSWEHGYYYPLIDNGMNYSEDNIGLIGPPPYLLIDTEKGVLVQNLKPAIYVKTILDRLFIDNGFSYRSEFFGSEYFKKLIIPNNGATLLGSDLVFDNTFSVELLSTPGYTSAGNYNTLNSNDNRINYTNELLDENDVYQASPTYSFVQPTDIFVQAFGADLKVNFLLAKNILNSSGSTPPNGPIFASDVYLRLGMVPIPGLTISTIYSCNINLKFRRDTFGTNGNVPVYGGEFYQDNASYSGTEVIKNGWLVPTPWDGVSTLVNIIPDIPYNFGGVYEYYVTGGRLYASFSCTVISDELDSRYDVQAGKYYNLNTNDKVDVIIHMDYNFIEALKDNGSILGDRLVQPATGGDLLLSNNNRFFNIVSNRVFPGGVISVNSSLSKKFKQKDFFKGLVTMFNLFVEPDPTNNKLLNIEPRDDYYNGGSNLDWTDKVDVSTIDFTFISDSQSKKTLLTYKNDGDYQNKQYTLQTEEIYGQYIETFDNDFIANENKIEASFSPTPIIALSGSGGFPMSRIAKDQNGGIYESNLRIMFRKYLPLEGPKNYFIIWKPLSDGGGYEIEYSYPWAGHLDNPYRPTYDLNFGQVYTSSYRWTPTNTLTDLYWRNYLDLINDTNSRFLMAKFYLNESDISNLSFKDTIFLNLNGRPMKFLINKISNYNPIISSLCDVELIKIK